MFISCTISLCVFYFNQIILNTILQKEFKICGVLFTFVEDENISVADSWQQNNLVLYLKESLSQQAV
jgi:hypothetical protein